MSTAPAVLRACGRTGARLAFSGALAIGLLATAPTNAHSATPVRAAAQPRAATTTAPSARQLRLATIDRAMRTAVRQKGDPYGYGAAGPNRFDCSGLTSYSYRKAGLRIPRTSSAQAHRARHIKRSQMRRGDLIFFTHGGRVYHVGLFAGRRHGHVLVLHAPYSGTRVRVDPVWTGSWFAGTLRGR